MLNLIKKEILINIRDLRAMFWMTLFPIMMILILGFAFSSQFSSNISIPKTRVIYNLGEDGVLSKELENFLNEMKDPLNMELEKGNKEEDIKKDIELGKYDIFIKLVETGEGENKESDIQLYYNEIRDMNAKLVESVISSFLQRYKALEGIAKVNPKVLEEIDMTSSPVFIQNETVGKNRTPSSSDYYAVTMITMTILYGIMAAALGIASERNRGTFDRVKTSASGFMKVFLSKIITGCMIVTTQIAIVFLFAKYAMNVYFGEDIITVFIIMMGLVLFAISFGTAMAFMIKNTAVIAMISNMFIMTMVFLGGGYIPLNIFGENNVLMYVGKISPVKWVNDAVFSVIYSGSKELVPGAIIVCISASMVFMIITMIIGLKSWPRKRGA